MHWALVQKDSFAQGLSNRTQIFCHHVQVAKGVVSESYKVLHKKRYQNSRIEERVNMRANLAMIESDYLFGCRTRVHYLRVLGLTEVLFDS